MQKIFQSCYEMDRRCYEAYGLNEDILMEHAARGMAEHIKSRFEPGASILIVAGPGNNGGDGMVLARQLHKSYDVRLMVPFGVKSLMAKVQLERCESVGVKITDEIKEAEVIVDALFGAGLLRTLDHETIRIVEQLNALEGYKIACDIPTGIDTKGRLSPIAFRADVTITMGALKEALFSDEAKEVVGKIECVDLGVSRSVYEMQSDSYLLELRDFNPPRRGALNVHKGTFGHAAIFCGQKEGAGIIAALACSRFGAGLTTLVLHEKSVVPPELMHDFSVPKKATALLVGPGLGNFFERDFLQKEVVQSALPIVLDADALYDEMLLSILEQKQRSVVVTPHPKEFCVMWEKIAGEKLSAEEVQQHRFDMARRFGERFGHVALLLKGANMLIAHDSKLFVNPHGSPKLAKGGSGDVLSGLIVALLAQGYGVKEAAVQGSLALAKAATLSEGNNFSLLPTDLIEALKGF